MKVEPLIKFRKANISDIDMVFSWLNEVHVREFWDNTQAHKDDIINFMNGRETSSNYADGQYTYWIGYIDAIPYSLIMTILEKDRYNIAPIKREYLSKTGNTYSVDYMIGNIDFYGKGLGAKTLKTFIEFFKGKYDKDADTFFIDPAIENTRAKHVYEKAGFKYVDDFIVDGCGCFAGNKACFLMKKL